MTPHHRRGLQRRAHRRAFVISHKPLVKLIELVEMPVREIPKTPNGKLLIRLARGHRLGYSCRTNDVDIILSVTQEYRKMVKAKLIQT